MCSKFPAQISQIPISGLFLFFVLPSREINKFNRYEWRGFFSRTFEIFAEVELFAADSNMFFCFVLFLHSMHMFLFTTVNIQSQSDRNLSSFHSPMIWEPGCAFAAPKFYFPIITNNNSFRYYFIHTRTRSNQVMWSRKTKAKCSCRVVDKLDWSKSRESL